MDDAERRADFTAYVAAREQPLARLAYLLTSNRDEAEDLLQTLQTQADLAHRARQGRQPISCRTAFGVQCSRTQLWRKVRSKRE